MPTSSVPRTHDEVTGAPPRPGRDGVAVGIAGVLVGVAGIMAAYGEFFPDAAAISVVLAGLAVWATRSPSRRLRLVIAALLAVFVAINLAYAMGDLAHPESPPRSSPLPWSSAVAWSPSCWPCSQPAVGPRPFAPSGPSPRRVRRPRGGQWPRRGRRRRRRPSARRHRDHRPRHRVPHRGHRRRRGPWPVRPQRGPLPPHPGDRGPGRRGRVPVSTDVRIPADLAPGTYRYYCDIAGHESMEGTLVVE